MTRSVIDFLVEDGCVPELAAEDAPRSTIEDGHANGRTAALTAGDILSWLEEREGEQDDAASEEAAPSVGVNAGDAAIGTRTAASADALDTAPAASFKGNLRRMAQAVLDVWNTGANRGTNQHDGCPGRSNGRVASDPRWRHATGGHRLAR